MLKSIRLLTTITICAVLLVGSGCGTKSDMPETAEVQGTVTLDSKPLANAKILFMPEEGQTSEAVTDEAGKYVLRYKGDIMGAKVGKHKVTISTFEEAVLNDMGQPEGGKPELVPTKYNTATTLEVTVDPEKTDPINFDLKSK